MAREIRAEMYEGNLARRQSYYTDCDRREYGGVKTERKAPGSGPQGSGREAGRGSAYGRCESRKAAWKEPVYENRRTAEAGSVSRAAVQRKPQNNGVRSRRKKRVQRRILTGILFYFLLAGIIATCWMIWSLFAGGEEKVHAESAVADDFEGMAEEGTDGENNGSLSLAVTPEIRQECQDLYEGQEELLILVNRDHELEASSQPILRSICRGRLEAADILYEDLCDLLKAGGEAGYEYWIASAYRDRSYQQGLVDEDVEKYMSKGYSYEAALQKTYEYTMPAGASEHETGLALDILCSTNMAMDESQAYEPGNRWLVEHCHEYGFILRYPEDKVDVTGISYEPWHFRYVGKEAAAYLKEKGWTLEEFYEAAGIIA